MSCLRGKLGLSILLFGNVWSFAITGSVIRLFLSRTGASEGWTRSKLPSATIIAPAVLPQTWNWIIRRICVTYVTVCVFVCVCLFVYISISFINVILDKVNENCCFVFYRAHFSYWLFCDSHVVSTSLCALTAVVGAINKNIWCHHVATKLTPEVAICCHQVTSAVPPIRGCNVLCATMLASGLQSVVSNCHQPGWHRNED